MAHPTSNSSSAYFNEVPVAAIVYSIWLSQRLNSSLFLNNLRKYASHGLTAVMIVISLFGAYQLSTILLPGDSPSMPPSVSSKAAAVATTPTAVAAAPGVSQLMSRSTPVQLDIPSINLSAGVTQVRLNNDGTMQVPDPEVVGWYNMGPSPGETGPSVMNGHLDSAVSGPAVFYNLKKVQVGDEIRVAREDGTTVTYVVDNVESFEISNFPTELVYGNIDYPGLRLITCDGSFNYITKQYSRNLIVFAKAINL